MSYEVKEDGYFKILSVLIKGGRGPKVAKIMLT